MRERLRGLPPETPEEHVEDCIDEIARYVGRYHERPRRVICSPRSYAVLLSVLADTPDRFRGVVDIGGHRDGISVMGVRVEVDHHALDGRFYAVRSLDYSDYGYRSLRMDHIWERMRAYVGEPRTIPNVPPVPGSFADALAAYLPTEIIREEMDRPNSFLDSLPRDWPGDYQRVYGRMEVVPPAAQTYTKQFLERAIQPVFPKRWVKSKACRNWERRMITSMKNFAKEYSV